MKRIIVCLKQAVDVSQLKVDPATRQLITASAPRKISDFDKNALEEAVRIKEKAAGSEILTLTVSAEEVKPVLREALAMGADKACFVYDSVLQGIDTSGIAYVLAQAVKKIGEFDLIICGEASLDGFSGLVGSRLSELLHLPLITAVRKISVEGEDLVAERTLEDSIETVKTRLPALITVSREINQPRIPSLMMIMKAAKKEIVAWTLADLGVQKEKITPKIEVIEALAPTMERKRIMIKGENVQEIAEELARALTREGVAGK